MVGESTPFPSLLDHKAWFILNMGPFTCLNHFSLGSPTISVFFAHRRPLFSWPARLISIHKCMECVEAVASSKLLVAKKSGGGETCGYPWGMVLKSIESEHEWTCIRVCWQWNRAQAWADREAVRLKALASHLAVITHRTEKSRRSKDAHGFAKKSIIEPKKLGQLLGFNFGVAHTFVSSVSCSMRRNKVLDFAGQPFACWIASGHPKFGLWKRFWFWSTGSTCLDTALTFDSLKLWIEAKCMLVCETNTYCC